MVGIIERFETFLRRERCPKHAIVFTPRNGSCSEERVGSSVAPERQYSWGRRFVDDLVLRDRDVNGRGTLDERLFVLQDPLASPVALADNVGIVRERYAYNTIWRCSGSLVFILHLE